MYNTFFIFTLNCALIDSLDILMLTIRLNISRFMVKLVIFETFLPKTRCCEDVLKMKSLLFLILLIFVAKGKCYDLFLGYPDMSARLIYSKVHQENPALWIRSEVFTVNCSNNDVISAIRILDMRQDKWGEAYVKAGGIGEKYVTIELDSPGIFRGYNFWVEVYAIQTSYFLYNHGKK